MNTYIKKLHQEFDQMAVPTEAINKHYTTLDYEDEFVTDVNLYLKLEPSWRNILQQNIDAWRYLPGAQVLFEVLTPYAYFYILPSLLDDAQKNRNCEELVDYFTSIAKAVSRNQRHGLDTAAYFTQVDKENLRLSISILETEDWEKQSINDSIIEIYEHLRNLSID